MEIAEHERSNDDNNREYEKRIAKMYSADDYTTRAVLYEFDGDYYIGGFALIEFESGWQIFSLSNPMAGIPPTGNLELLDDEDDFEDRLE